jgi:hypothetical protein
MAKLKLKTVVQAAFFASVAIAILFQAASVYSRWRTGRQIRAEVWANARVTVLRTDPRFPPGILLEYVNGSRFAIDKSRFNLTFTLAGRPAAAAERDFREVKPGQTVHVLLQSVATDPAAAPPPPGTRLAYTITVLPGQRKPLPEVAGELEIR